MFLFSPSFFFELVVADMVTVWYTRKHTYRTNPPFLFPNFVLVVFLRQNSQGIVQLSLLNVRITRKALGWIHLVEVVVNAQGHNVLVGHPWVLDASYFGSRSSSSSSSLLSR